MYEIIKRMLDFLLATVSLIVLFPLFAIISVCIMIDDPTGGPFFVQERVGKNGTVFDMYKFRSMERNAEEKKKGLMKFNEMDRVAFKISNDPRVTKPGHFLRKTNLDELPQLYNVLIGQMSLVGPRPPLPEEVKLYSAYERRRLSVLPGMTCFWQIQPQRHKLSFDKWMELDMKYIENRCLKTDTVIIVKTMIRMLNFDTCLMKILEIKRADRFCHGHKRR